jgi:hypothetical protein
VHWQVALLQLPQSPATSSVVSRASPAPRTLFPEHHFRGVVCSLTVATVFARAGQILHMGDAGDYDLRTWGSERLKRTRGTKMANPKSPLFRSAKSRFVKIKTCVCGNNAWRPHSAMADHSCCGKTDKRTTPPFRTPPAHP